MVLAILDSSFLSMSGINDVLLITFSVARPGSMFELAGLTALGSVIGCSLLYAVGAREEKPFSRSCSPMNAWRKSMPGTASTESLPSLFLPCFRLRHH